ncbi:MAG: ATP-binding protein, partial [Alphaproteobacteria bacterium]
PLTLLADERATKQMMLNLMSNAVKFTPQDGRIVIHGAIAPDGWFELVVTDTGIGIAKEDLAKVLEPFGQSDSSLTREYEGTGLGLPLTEKLIELHGGSLEIESEPGRGTRVSLRFPPHRVEAATVADKGAASAA